MKNQNYCVFTSLWTRWVTTELLCNEKTRSSFRSSFTGEVVIVFYVGKEKYSIFSNAKVGKILLTGDDRVFSAIELK